MYVASIPNRNSPPAVLLRESYREDGKVRNRTLANLSNWPAAKVDALRAVLKGASANVLEESFDIVRSRPHGHVAAVLGTLRRLGLDSLMASRRSRQRDLAVSMVVARVIDPRSKLVTARGLSEDTLTSSLGEALGVQDAGADDLYEAMDWLLERQPRIEASLAKRQLQNGSLVLYDLTSTYFEGEGCPLARRGYSRDGQKDKLQIVFGLLTDAAGCPVAVEVFDGNTGDPKTVRPQVEKLRDRFGLERIVLVGDRGMLTSARIEEDLMTSPGFDWISALRGPAIRKLVDAGAFDLSLFDERDLAEIISPDYPNERLIVCRNPLLATKRAYKRQELLAATEKELQKIVEATARAQRALRGADKIGLRVGRVLGRFKMAKHFRIEITDHTFSFQRDLANIESEAALDGLYVIRTSVRADQLATEEAVRTYKRLSQVERAFRSFKTIDLRVRPIHHRLADRVRAHVFLCMLAYWVEWHMRQALAPLLYDDEDHAGAEHRRSSAVAPAQRSHRAERKARTGRTEQDTPIHSFRSLLSDLATLAINRVQPKQSTAQAFDLHTAPTPLQQKTFDLLRVSLRT